MPHSLRSASPLLSQTGRRPMRWRAARRSATTRRYARRSTCSTAAAGSVPFERFSALLRAPELQASASRSERRGATRYDAPEPGAERGDAARLAGSRAGHRPRPGARAARRSGAARRRAPHARGTAGTSPYEPLALDLDRSLRAGTVVLAGALVERRISIGRSLSRVARNPGARGSNFRVPLAPRRRKHSGAGGARYALPDTDRRPAHLGEQPAE